MKIGKSSGNECVSEFSSERDCKDSDKSDSK